MIDPYRQDKDQGEKSNYQIFSNGPYKLDGHVEQEQGRTFVRNDNYDPATDSTDIRKALPDKINFNVGQTTEMINDRLIADNGDDQYAVTSQPRPAGLLQPDHGCGRGPRDPGRLAVHRLPGAELPSPEGPGDPSGARSATNAQAWINAGGGEKAYGPAESIVNPTVVGYQPNPAFADDNDGGRRRGRQEAPRGGRHQDAVPDQVHLPDRPRPWTRWPRR